MTEQPQPSQHTGSRRKPRLYRTLLSIAVAALVAAWLPFSIIYIDALTKHAALVSTTVSAHQTGTVGAAHGTTSLTPVTTRTS